MSDDERLLPFCQPDQFALLPLVSRWCGAHNRTLDYCRNEAAETLLASGVGFPEDGLREAAEAAVAAWRRVEYVAYADLGDGMTEDDLLAAGLTLDEPMGRLKAYVRSMTDGDTAGDSAALRSTPAAPQPDPSLSSRDTGYVAALRDHDECCGTLRNHVPTTAHPSPADAPAPQSLRDALTNIIEEAEEVTIHQHGNPVSVLQSVVIDARNARAALDAPVLTAPQSLRDAALPCGHRFPSNGGRCYGSAAWHDGEKGKHAYLPVDRRSGRDRRAALDAPALTVDREAVSETVECPACGEVGEAVCVCEHCGHRAPMTRFGRALGEGAGEGVDRG